MPLVTVINGCSVDPIPFEAPDGTKGKLLTITLVDRGDVIQIPMSDDIARKVGTKLMGLGTVEIPRINGHSGPAA
jgi:hypothetical protein